MAFIEAIALNKTLDGRAILKDISLSLAKGETLALLGATGAGKTTLLRVLGLLDAPDSGALLFDGVDVTSSTAARLAARRRTGFVLQKPVLFNASIHENIACGARWRGRPCPIEDTVEALMGELKLSAYRRRNARTLSGGETQKVAIARAIISEPDLLLLDEPTANLDLASAWEVEEIVKRVIARRATTVVIATHDIAQARRFADRLCIIKDGALVPGDTRSIAGMDVDFAGFLADIYQRDPEKDKV